MPEKFCIDCVETISSGDENENCTTEGLWVNLFEPEELDDFQCEGCGDIVIGTSWLCERVY